MDNLEKMKPLTRLSEQEDGKSHGLLVFSLQAKRPNNISNL